LLSRRYSAASGTFRICGNSAVVSGNVTPLRVRRYLGSSLPWVRGWRSALQATRLPPALHGLTTVCYASIRFYSVARQMDSHSAL
jgi:hypothetical protein